jgi:hypothetical protein
MCIVKNHKHAVLINMLLDNVFLEIFKFCLCNDFSLSDDSIYHKRKWQTLVHVCQRWQILIFASPHQLELYLSCANRVSVRKNLGFWPVTLPLSLFYCHQITPEDEDNIVAILDYPSHVHSIKIHARAPLIKKSGRRHAEVIPHADTSGPYVLSLGVGPFPNPSHSQDVLGRVCPISTTSQCTITFLSTLVNTFVVRLQPCHSHTQTNTPGSLHSTGGHGQNSGHVDQPH